MQQFLVDFNWYYEIERYIFMFIGKVFIDNEARGQTDSKAKIDEAIHCHNQ